GPLLTGRGAITKAAGADKELFTQLIADGKTIQEAVKLTQQQTEKIKVKPQTKFGFRLVKKKT
ncbi:hypothetical protein ACFL2C_04450, partial [Patescibacteria group bacterium]